MYLGCATEYVVHLEAMHALRPPRGYTDADDDLPLPVVSVLHEFDWTTIKWGRVGNEVSIAQVALARDQYGESCCTYPLVAWEHCLAIYRDGQRVWQGPVIGWGHDEDGDMTIIAHDILAFTKKAFLPQDQDLVGSLSSVVSTLMNQIAFSWGSVVLWQNMDPELTGGAAPVNVDRKFQFRQLKTMFEIMSELANDAGLTFTAGPEVVHYDQYPFNNGADSPALSVTTTLSDPKVTIDASNLAIDNLVANAASGVGGYQRIENVVLAFSFASTPPSYTEWFLAETAEPDPRLPFLPTVLAGLPSAVERLRPNVTIESLRLDPAYGSDQLGTVRGAAINELVPGALARWGFDIDCLQDVGVATFGEITDEYISYHLDDRIRYTKLVQLDVNVSRGDDGLVEDITSAWVPIAYADGEFENTYIFYTDTFEE